MNVDLASKIVSLRLGIECLIVRYTQQPDQIVNHQQTIDEFCRLITYLSDQQFVHVNFHKIDDNEQQNNSSINRFQSQRAFSFPSFHRGRGTNIYGQHSIPNK